MFLALGHALLCLVGCPVLTDRTMLDGTTLDGTTLEGTRLEGNGFDRFFIRRSRLTRISLGGDAPYQNYGLKWCKLNGLLCAQWSALHLMPSKTP